jgi:hypothetical protein
LKRHSIRTWKSQRGCIDCGTTDPDALDCDHDGEDKVANIADLRAPAALAIELTKVVVRCVSCHRKITAARRALPAQERAELDEIAATVDLG